MTTHSIRIFGIALLLAVVTLVAYRSIGSHNFIHLDDAIYVTDNPHIVGGMSWRAIAWAFSDVEQANMWHPVTWLSHMLDVELYGLQPRGHFVSNLMYHTLTTVVFFLALQALTGATWRSAFVAALFGVHPLHVESVAWVAERKDQLCALFWALSMLAYARYARLCSPPADTATPNAGARRFRAYLATFLAFVLAIMSKPMAVTLPCALLLLDFWPLGRLRIARFSGPPMLPIILEKVPFFLLSVLASFGSFIGESGAGALSPLGNHAVGYRLGNMLIGYATYLCQVFWPANLAVFYPLAPSPLPAGRVLGAALLLITITSACLYSLRTRPWAAVGWAWFVGTLFPVSGIIQQGSYARADRYTYIPLIGIFIILAWIGNDVVTRVTRTSRLSWRLPSHRQAILVSAGCVLLTLAACVHATHAQLHYWRNSMTLFTRAVAVTRENWVIHGNLGTLLHREGRPEEALPHYQVELRHMPFSPVTHFKIGTALSELGRPADAEPYFREAVRLQASFVQAHGRLGDMLRESGKLDQAVSAYRMALRLNHRYPEAHMGLGQALMQKGDIHEALEHFRTALVLEPSLIPAYLAAAEAEHTLGRTEAAMRALHKALSIQPNAPTVRERLARYAEIRDQTLPP